MTKFLVAMMIMAATLLSPRVAKAHGPEGFSFVAGIGALRFPGAQVINYDLGVSFHSKPAPFVWQPVNFNFPIYNSWNFKLMIGSDARVGQYSSIYRLARWTATFDGKYQAGEVLGWRLIGRLVFAETTQAGLFTGPSLTFYRDNHFEWDIAVVGGKFYGQPEGQGAAMAVMTLSIG